MGELLQELRKDRGWSQKYVAEQLGVKRPNIRTEIVKGVNDIFCSLGEVGSVGRVAPQKLAITTSPVKPILPYNEANENGEQDFYPVPRFRRRSGTAKIQTINDLRVEIFVRKYYLSIDGLYRCNNN